MVAARSLLSLALLCGLVASCAPEPQAAPVEWRAVHYASGLTLSVPPDAAVAWPPRIDSLPMEVRGAGYSLDFDNDGEFRGPANAIVGGRSAVVSQTSIAACVRKSVEIELREPSLLTPPLCDQAGKNCSKLNGVAQIIARCVPGEGCDIVDKMIGSIRLVPPPYPQWPAPDESYQQLPPVCRLPTDG